MTVVYLFLKFHLRYFATYSKTTVKPLFNCVVMNNVITQKIIKAHQISASAYRWTHRAMRLLLSTLKLSINTHTKKRLGQRVIYSYLTTLLGLKHSSPNI